jgi:nucleoid DNA-binding protein
MERLNMNKSELIKKIASQASITIDEATRALSCFEEDIYPELESEEESEAKSFSWRNGTRKKGGKFKYQRT